MLQYEYQEVVVRKRSAIPHWHVPGGLYFVTWRLANCVPYEHERRLLELRHELMRARMNGADLRIQLSIEREVFRLLDRVLDAGHGPAYMKNASIADMVQRTLEFRDGVDYDLITHTVMPTHVHVVFRLLAELDAVLQQWKSVTAHRANLILGRRGPFWETDYFDVLVRHSRQLEKIVAYVRSNPAKAGLTEWRWSRLWAERYANCL
jgi:hypothetical protein